MNESAISNIDKVIDFIKECDDSDIEVEDKKAVIDALLERQKNRKLKKEITKKLDKLMISYNDGLIRNLPYEEKILLDKSLDTIKKNNEFLERNAIKCSDISQIKKLIPEKSKSRATFAELREKIRCQSEKKIEQREEPPKKIQK